MAQSGYTPIQLYYSSTATNVPLAANLAAGELAINTADEKLYFKNASGTVKLLASSGASAVGGSNTQVQYNSSGTFAGSANLTFDGTTLTAAGLSDSGNLTFTGTGNRITGDFSNATVANRVAFQTSTTNGASAIGVIPNGTATYSELSVNTDSAYTNSSTLSMIVDGTTASVKAAIRGTGSYLPMTFYTGGSERMRIDTSGNVGIGTSSPSYPLDVAGQIRMQNAGYLRLTSTGTTALGYFGSYAGIIGSGSSSDILLHNAQAGSIGFQTNGVTTNRMTIDSSGNVGIGTSSPSYKLDVSGNIRSNNGGNANYLLYDGTTTSHFQQNSSTVYFNANADSATNGAFIWRSTSSFTERMRITSTGGLNVGAYVSDPGVGAIYASGNITAYFSSDRRLKENIQDVDNALDIVCAIGSKTFDWTDNYIASKGGEDGYFVQKSDFGVVAQDVQEVFPQAVRTREDGTLAVDYEKLATLSFGAIKQLLARVEALEAK